MFRRNNEEKPEKRNIISELIQPYKLLLYYFYAYINDTFINIGDS
jgi:hypothetical protein